MATASDPQFDEEGIKEGLAELFIWWYGNHRPVVSVLLDGWSCPRNETSAPTSSPSGALAAPELSASALDAAWRTRWFAKGSLAERVDADARDRFGNLLSATVAADDNENSERGRRRGEEEASMPLWERLARIVLYDQIPRNALRGRPEAYATDGMALRLALVLASDVDAMARLPLHFQTTVLVCLCHSERTDHQRLLGRILGGDAFQRYRRGCTLPFAVALDGILRRHAERVHLFGRFPERNAILGRTSTPAEQAWLRQLK